MNKKNILLYIIVFCLVLVGCNKNPDDKKEEITNKFDIEKIVNEYASNINDSFIYRCGIKISNNEENDYIKIVYNKKNDCISYTFLNYEETINDFSRKLIGYIQFDTTIDKYIYTNSITKTYRISNETEIFKVFEEAFGTSMTDYMNKEAKSLFALDDDNTYKFIKYNGYEINVNDLYYKYEIKENDLKPIDISEYIVHPFCD